jgi:hypothetical protein
MTPFLVLDGRKKPSSVTSTSSSGKIEKNAQKAIMLARLVDSSSVNFLTTAIGIATALCCCW